MNVETLKAHLRRDEDLRLKLYRCTAGKLSIGVGRNIEDRGISEAEAMMMLGNDIFGTLEDLDHNIPWWRALPEPVQQAIANMAFNLGWPRLAGFKRMLSALRAGNYVTAAQEALDSKWADDVGAGRAGRIADLIRQGQGGDHGIT